MSRMKDLLGDTPYLPREAYQITRREDPATSFDAAARIVPQLKELQRVVFEVLLEAGPHGLTDIELDVRCITKHGKRGYSTYRTRRAELVELGYVGDSGRKRFLEGSDRKVWVIKEKLA
jgi:hypothetical protein